MPLKPKQITFYRPSRISTRINEGVRAVGETYDGIIQRASDHCVNQVAGLSEHRLTKLRGNDPPGSTKDGASFITLVWVLLVDGMRRYRQPRAIREWFIDLINATDLLEGDLTDERIPTLTGIFAASIEFKTDETPDSASVARIIQQVWAGDVGAASPDSQREIPIPPPLFIGRDDDMQALHHRLGVDDRSTRQPLTIVRGWPGVGKTALINTIAHDPDVRSAFVDGVLWDSLGEHGDVLSTLKGWARQLGALHLLQIRDEEDMVRGLRVVLSGRDILLIADDIWTEAQGNYIKSAVDLTTNTLLLTTRFTDVARTLSDLERDVYVLDVLSEPHAIELLTVLAPDAAKRYAPRFPKLAESLEGLPLALRVAGPTIQYYHKMNFDVNALIDEFINEYNRLLESQAPADRFDERTGKTPTIELLFERSVQTLPENAQLAFARLGVFQHKPATFAAKALSRVWKVDHSQPLIMAIAGRGLMDAMPDGRYRIHQTLHMYANKLLDNY